MTKGMEEARRNMIKVALKNGSLHHAVKVTTVLPAS